MYHGSPTDRAAIRKTTFGPLYRQAREAKEHKKAILKMLLEEEKARAKRKAAGIEESEEQEAKHGEEDHDSDEKLRVKVRSMPVIVSLCRGLKRSY